MKLKTLPALLLLGLFFGLTGCDDESSTQVPPPFRQDLNLKIDFSLGQFAVSDEVKNACDSGNWVNAISVGASNDTDSKLFRIIDSAPVAKRDRCASTLADFLETSMSSVTKTLSEKPRRAPDDPDFDVLIVGAGVHGAVLARTLSLENPDVKILIVDKAPHPAEHFRTNGFKLNSPTMPKDTNSLPNAPIKIALHTDPIAGTQKNFPVARQMWNHLIFTEFASNSWLFLNTSVADIKKADTAKDLYAVKLEGQDKLKNGRIVLVKKIVFAGGLGLEEQPRTNYPKELITQIKMGREYSSSASPMPVIMTYDTMFHINSVLLKENKSIFDYFNGKIVSVAGAGDSGKIAVEFLAGLAPDLAYVDASGNRHAPRLSTLFWLGQRSSDYAAFATAAETKARYKYEGLRQLFDEKKTPDGTKIKFRAYKQKVERVTLKKNEINFVLRGIAGTNSTDFLITSIGYKSQLDSVIESLSVFKDQLSTTDKLQFRNYRAYVDPHAHLKGSFENVAIQACVGTQCEDIFVVGTAAGNRLTVSDDRKADTVTKNAVSIETLTPLTMGFGRSPVFADI